MILCLVARKERKEVVEVELPWNNKLKLMLVLRIIILYYYNYAGIAHAVLCLIISDELYIHSKYTAHAHDHVKTLLTKECLCPCYPGRVNSQ